jgi:hypothetical protein
MKEHKLSLETIIFMLQKVQDEQTTKLGLEESGVTLCFKEFQDSYRLDISKEMVEDLIGKV